MRILTVGIALMLLAVPASASARARLNRTALVANYDSQAIQNERANEYGLSRMRNTAMVQRFYRAGYLVPVPASTRSYYLHEIAPPYRYLRPWAKLFLDRLSSEYYGQFGQPLRVTSLVRTVDSQLRLARFDPNAAAARGPHRSAHLTGAALDISKHSMSYQEVEWMRRTLYELKREGVVYAIEEFVEPNFHIMVYPTYSRYVARLERISSDAEPTATAARHVQRADTSAR